MKTTIALLMLLSVGPAHAAPERKALDGWGPFKFSMSMSQAMNATKGSNRIGEAAGLEYPCNIAGQPFMAIVKFTDDDERVRYINLVDKDGPNLDDKSLAAEYGHLIEILAKQYGPPDMQAPAASDANRATGHFGPEASTLFKFADGGSIEVHEQAGWRPSVYIRYTPGLPQESF